MSVVRLLRRWSVEAGSRTYSSRYTTGGFERSLCFWRYGRWHLKIVFWRAR